MGRGPPTGPRPFALPALRSSGVVQPISSTPLRPALPRSSSTRSASVRGHPHPHRPSSWWGGTRTPDLRLVRARSIPTGKAPTCDDAWCERLSASLLPDQACRRELAVETLHVALACPKQYRGDGGRERWRWIGGRTRNSWWPSGWTTLHSKTHRRHRAALLGFAARRARTPDEVVDLVGAVWHD